MKRIAIVKWKSDNSGGQKVAVNLANELSAKYNVHLVSMISDEEIFYPLNNSVRYDNLTTGKISMKKNFIKAVKLLRSYIIENKIDIVFGIGMTMNSVGVVSTLGVKTKFISCDHTNSIVDIDTKVKRFQRYVASKFADKIITLTNADKKNYIQKYRMDPAKIEYIYNWIEDLEEIPAFSIDDKKLLTAGRFDNQKGYDYLSEVAINVLSKCPDWKWDIYGTGDEGIKQELIKKLELGNVLSQVNFMGNVKGTDNIYPNHAIYVMTSRYEGLPLVLLEAKQYGLPIVSFDCPTGPAEIVLDNKNGFLIENYDTKKMSKKIIELIDNKNLRQQFSNNSMMDTEKFNKEKILQQWIDLIEKITGE